jgi:hypothetical protein
MPDAERVHEFRQELGKDFDKALADVTRALASVPRAIAVPLPGFEASPESDLDEERASRTPSSLDAQNNPYQGQFDLWTSPSQGDGVDDPIDAFAPDPAIDWGPRRPTLTHRNDTPKEVRS